MRIGYLDCACGISGDMTLAALIDAGVDPEAIRRAVDSLDLPGVRLHVDKVLKGGFRATYIRIEHPEQHAHRHLRDIFQIIERGSALTDPQRDLAKRIFTAVATAEAKVHGSTIDQIHFHEVGAIDSIVDIVGAAVGFDLLGADRILCSKIPTGRGQVQIDHGICTVPTPGTAELLRGIPLVDVPVEAELTTPTGAAIVATVVHEFGPLPEMTIQQIGYGAGTKDFPGRANVLRLFVGQADVSAASDQVVVLETNLDDVSGEIVGYTKRKLLEAGALDVFSTAIQMKKDRPGVLLSVLCEPVDQERLESLLFLETGTLGIRRQTMQRSKRFRAEHRVETVWGPIAGKLGWRTQEQPIFTPEYESCAEVAARHGVPLRVVYRTAEQAFAERPTIPPTTAFRLMPRQKKFGPVSSHEHSQEQVHDHDHDHDQHGGHDHG